MAFRDNLCVICGLELAEKKRSPALIDAFDCDCPKCGTYRIAGTWDTALRSEPSSPIQTAALCHMIRKLNHRREYPELLIDTISDLRSSPVLPRPNELVNNLVLWLGEDSVVFGSQISTTSVAATAIVGAIDDDALRLIVDHLVGNDLITSEGSMGPDYTLALTLNGWDRYDELQRNSEDSKRTFMAMPFGDESLNRIFREVYTPAVNDAGFMLWRLDDAPPAGSIDDRLRVAIRTSRFIIAELTGGNRGAYWEAGYAEGLGKPVIYTCRRDYKNEIHFDTAHFHTVFWNEGEDDITARNLKATIRATFPADAIMLDTELDRG